MNFKSGMVAILFVVFASLLVFQNDRIFAQEKSPETEVRAILAKFKTGIEDGDTILGQQLTTGSDSNSFLSLYNLLAATFSQQKISFPMEIGHIKILADGRAKVETYLTHGKNLFVFTLKKENDQWKFCHSECIRFPIYEIPNLPYEAIYQLPPEERTWTIAETEIAFESRVFYQLKQDHGEEFAQNFFLDGPGFRVSMDAWLPFIEGAAQLAIYCAILETNFYGSKCVITRASYNEAEIHFTPLAKLEVLNRAYFNPKFSFEEYKKLYGLIMESRASACGLEMEIAYNETNCIIKLKRIGKKNDSK
jgi:hypothetical protein